MFRGITLSRIRGEILTLSRRLRSLSSATGGEIKTRELNHMSLFSRSPSIDKCDDEISSDTCGEIKTRELNHMSLFSRSASIEKCDDEIKRLASYVTSRIDETIKHGRPSLPLVFGSEVYLLTDDEYKTYSPHCKLEIMSLAAHAIYNIAETDEIQMYQARRYYNTMLNTSNWGKYLTEDKIIERVLLVTQLYPKIGIYRVTEETHFIEDLGFDKWDIIEVIQALQFEFRLSIPYDIVSCKLAIDYIYEHREERLSRSDFEEHVYLTTQFGESKSEFRRIFVPGVRKERENDTMHEMYCQAFNINGFKPYIFFMNMKRWLHI